MGIKKLRFSTNNSLYLANNQDGAIKNGTLIGIRMGSMINRTVPIRSHLQLKGQLYISATWKNTGRFMCGPRPVPVCVSDMLLTRGQSNLTKSASRAAHSPVRGHPRGSKVVPLNSWGRFPISVP